MQRVLVSAPAKVNLGLRVGGPRPDGFHPLDTVFEALDIFDDVEVTPADELSLEFTSPDRSIDVAELPVDGSNLAMRAAHELLRRRGLLGSADAPGARIKITKRIPIAGGMAGGSADAAGTLVALNKLWDLGFSDHDLEHIAADLGSDVPFALKGSIAHGQGRGEHLHEVPVMAIHGWVLLTRSDGLSTPEVFREFDRLNPDAGEPASTVELREALSSGTLADVAAAMVNDLEQPAVSLNPELGHVLVQVRADGHAAILSGSGPTVAVLTEPATLRALAAELAARYPDTQVITAYGPAPGAHIRED
ncbi:4-diphosphocytidyl-2-C-methyl-D-erythritol kinase [Trueperella bonasi]|uniref:4-diphosphocytidyl-2-C-methyl-D-erythritol kinase n=1 Tax=Trueperella bonasi TaxID=312286 RepID=A0ABT9NFK8_9ACTO|nr:4-(cytidine 5'-diphospho)-2-C-methyl-D-erythritol kinase [Trueperella bonasi]MDP9806140.1 4-diphosphocytidyl-2-C-methyl-D-erythritol kinase [Trueperella bonasi]